MNNTCELPKLATGTKLRCIADHPDGFYTVGRCYKINAYQVGGNNVHARIRDDKRERKDFNFLPHSKNYIWKYFQTLEEN